MRPTLLLALCFVLAFQTVHCQTYWTDAFIYFQYWYPVREGTLKAFFDNPNDPTQRCWVAFDTVRNTYSKLPYWEEVTWQTWPLAIKRFMDILVVTFNFYALCNLDNLLLEIGKRISSWSGIVQLVISTFFLFNDRLRNTEWQQEIIDAIELANETGEDSDWEMVGYPIGELISEFLHFQVPNYDYEYASFARFA